MPTRAQTLAAELIERRNTVAGYFAKKTADGRLDWTAEDRDKVKSLNDELNEKTAAWETARADDIAEEKNKAALEKLAEFRMPGSFQTREGTGTTKGSAMEQGIYGHDGAYLPACGIGDAIITTKAYQALQGHRTSHGRFPNGDKQFSLPDWHVKTLFATTAGFDPFVPRLPKIQLSPQQQPKVVDLLPTSETTFHSIKWMLETTYTNASAPTTEGTLYPESALTFTEQLTPVQKIAVYLPVTDEQFEDAPMTRDLVNNRLTLMLRQTLDKQLLLGNGTAPNLTGLATVAGIQNQPKGTDPGPSAIHKAMTLIRTVGFADPSGVIFNPIDWQNIKLLQTADGLYIWGHPADNNPDRIWGLPVVQTTYQTLGTAVVADFAAHTELIWRKGIEFLVSNSHLDFFQRGQQAIRADIRVAFLCYRGQAVCTVNGM